MCFLYFRLICQKDVIWSRIVPRQLVCSPSSRFLLLCLDHLPMEAMMSGERETNSVYFKEYQLEFWNMPVKLHAKQLFRYVCRNCGILLTARIIFVWMNVHRRSAINFYNAWITVCHTCLLHGLCLYLQQCHWPPCESVVDWHNRLGVRQGCHAHLDPVLRRGGHLYWSLDLGSTCH